MDPTVGAMGSDPRRAMSPWLPAEHKGLTPWLRRANTGKSDGAGMMLRS